MAKKGEHVQVEIFDQAYTVRAGKQAGYIESLARYVDEQMRAVSRDNTTVDSLKIAVLAALNIADELHRERAHSGDDAQQFQQRAEVLSSHLAAVLDED